MEKVVRTTVILVAVLFILFFYRKPEDSTNTHNTQSTPWRPQTTSNQIAIQNVSLYGDESASHLKLLQILDSLTKQQSVELSMSLNEGLNVRPALAGVRYLTIEKSESGCEFPEFHLNVTGKGIYLNTKGYQGIDISSSKRFYFIQSHPDFVDKIQRLQYYLFQNPGNLCNSYKVNFYTTDFNKSLNPLQQQVDQYNISIGQKEYGELLAGIPDKSEDRYNSNFQFPSVKAELTYQNTVYDMKIKNRGVTSLHWANDKKSYTINFKDYFKHNEKLLFYIPDKRAYIGEYLVNELAHEMSLPALISGFATLRINQKDHGMYYVTEDFDGLFLAKRNLPEANIYNTDPYKNPAEFTAQALPKDMILSTLNNFEQNYDRDADYFLKVIRMDTEELTRNWKYYFDEENLARILVLYSITGTAHYDLHNMVFYINPTDGRISFFPWDFMNYTHVGDIEIYNNETQSRDFMNLNPIFTKLMEIPEIRDLRNKNIITYSDKLQTRISVFQEKEHVGLFTNFLTDPTIDLAAGEGNRPSFVTFLALPQILEKNITYLNKQITEVAIRTFLSEKNKIDVYNDSFGTVVLRKIILPISTLPGYIRINNIVVPTSDYEMMKLDSGEVVITLKEKTVLSPILAYDKKYGAPINLKPTHIQIDVVYTDNRTITEGVIEFENVATGKTETVSFTQEIPTGATPVSIISPKMTSNFLHPLLKETDPGNFTFKKEKVEINENILIPKGITLTIQPGTHIAFAKDTSLISYGRIVARGTKQEPIVFTGKDKNTEWGTVGLVQEDASGEFVYCIFENGNDAQTEDNVYFSGMLSSYYSNIILENSIIRNGNQKSGDDGVNVKYAKARIKNNTFYKNKFDGLDLDFVKKGSIVSGNSFEKNGNDGMDISGTTDLIIKNNKIRTSGDKGISVGEDSHITIINNSIEDTQMGIAVKDNSTVILNHNNIINNSVGAAAYNKKELFGGGHIKVYNTLFKENKQDFGLESISKRDRRFLDQDYQSTIEVINSKYRLTGKETKELIKESQKSVTKRDTLETFLKGKLTTAKGTYATLKDTASRMKDYNLSDINNPIGTTK